MLSSPLSFSLLQVLIVCSFRDTGQAPMRLEFPASCVCSKLLILLSVYLGHLFSSRFFSILWQDSINSPCGCRAGHAAMQLGRLIFSALLNSLYCQTGPVPVECTSNHVWLPVASQSDICANFSHRVCSWKCIQLCFSSPLMGAAQPCVQGFLVDSAWRSVRFCISMAFLQNSLFGDVENVIF